MGALGWVGTEFGGLSKGVGGICTLPLGGRDAFSERPDRLDAFSYVCRGYL